MGGELFDGILTLLGFLLKNAYVPFLIFHIKITKNYLKLFFDKKEEKIVSIFLKYLMLLLPLIFYLKIII